MFYDVFLELCKSGNISQAKAVQDVGLNRAAITKWKNGSSPNSSTVARIAAYFNVSTDYLLGNADKGITEGSKQVTDDDIKFALFGGDVSDETFEDVKRFAAFIQAEKENNKKKG